MRRALLFGFSVLALALPAAAQDRARMTAPAPQPTRPAALRGPLGAPISPAAPAANAALARAGLALQTPIAPLTPTPQPLGALALPPLGALPADGQCRQSCSRSYYFCLAGDDADVCAPAWSQCRATCDVSGLGLR
jgi:hypothetical protein